MPETEISFEHLKELLLLLCRYPFEDSTRTTLSKLIGEVKDWQKMVELINAHGIIALAAYNIREAGLEKTIPEDAVTFLNNGGMKSMVRNTWLTERWKEVNTILTNSGIRHVLLKGMALEHTVYGSRGLRQMTDIDVLVKKEDSLKAWHLLQKYGFVSDMIKSRLHRKIIAETGKHMPTLRKDGYAVEIHYRLFHEAEMNDKLNDAIDNAVEIDIEGLKAFILNDNIHLDYLREHNQDHLSAEGSQLRLFVDMEIIKPGSAPVITKEFLSGRHQSYNSKHGKDAYKVHFFTLPSGIRFRYLVGDIFPSLRWMKQRHNCGTTKAILLYPRRIGKLFWLAG